MKNWNDVRRSAKEPRYPSKLHSFSEDNFDKRLFSEGSFWDSDEVDWDDEFMDGEFYPISLDEFDAYDPNRRSLYSINDYLMQDKLDEEAKISESKPRSLSREPIEPMASDKMPLYRGKSVEELTKSQDNLGWFFKLPFSSLNKKEEPYRWHPRGSLSDSYSDDQTRPGPMDGWW